MKVLIETTGKFALVDGYYLDNNAHPDRPSIVNFSPFYQGREQLGQIRVLLKPVDPQWTDADADRLWKLGASVDALISAFTPAADLPAPAAPPAPAPRTSKKGKTA